MRTATTLLLLLSCSRIGAAAAEAERRPFRPGDVAALHAVSDPRVSPDGEWVAYVVTTSDLEEDRMASELWMVRWDGSRRVRLTHSEASESSPRWSPDGRYLSFLAKRGDDDEKAQVWLLDRAGGEARRLTEMPGGVNDFAWSPDASRLALIASDPDPDEVDAESEKPQTPKPIVIDRYRFKRDVTGYLRNQRDHLYLFDVASEEAETLTSGDFDVAQPAWSPDGSRLVFASKRGDDPDRHDDWNLYLIEARAGAEARVLTRWEGADGAPSSAPPAWSPDGEWIAYVRGGAPKYQDYDPSRIGVVSGSGGEERVVTGQLDYWVDSPAWSADGRHLYFLLEDDRNRLVARTPASGGPVERLGEAPGVTRSFSLAAERLAAVVTRPHQPAEVFALEGAAGWRALSDHNRELLERVDFGAVEGVSFPSAGGAEVHGLLVKPPGFEPGRRYPAIAYIHGGPVGQDGFEFDPIWQVLAGRGYLVVAPNYRGSSGRGQAFSRAIYADWGNLEVKDTLAAVDHLVSRGLADPERLGIGGWSYGGMTTNYAIARDSRFKAAVSGAAISNMITGYGTDQYVRQYENEIGLPWEGIETYLKVSYPFFEADRIRTPTLFLCGEKDFNVPLINSEQMYQALRSLGVPTRLVIYPGQFHSLRKPSYVRDRLERTLEWFDRYLDPTGSGASPASPAPQGP
jgi:dipeptidyl aminopeptidase/acylaminoacyl peptidase